MGYKNQSLVLFVSILFLLSTLSTQTHVLFISYSYQSSDFPSEITPFNHTIVLSWSPKDIDYSNWKALENGTILYQRGVLKTFYATTFPLFPHMAILNSSLKVVSLSGPSNITVLAYISRTTSSTISTAGFNSLQTNKTTFKYNSFNVSDLNSGSYINNSILYHQSYSFINKNASYNVQYSQLAIQPVADENDTNWNHSLTIEISFAGYEDLAFYNYIREQHGKTAWDTKIFDPISFFGVNHSNDFTPYDQPNPDYFYSPEKIIYSSNSQILENESNPNLKSYTISAKINSNKEVGFYIEISRKFVPLPNRGNYFGASKMYSLYVPIQGMINISFNWNTLDGVNLSINQILIKQDYVSINSSQGLQYDGTLGNFSGYEFLDQIAIGVIALNQDWSHNGTLTWNLFENNESALLPINGIRINTSAFSSDLLNKIYGSLSTTTSSSEITTSTNTISTNSTKSASSTVDYSVIGVMMTMFVFLTKKRRMKR